MIIPLKKCYQTTKLGFLLFIILIVLTLSEHLRGRKIGAYGFAPGSKEFEYEAQTLTDKARIESGLGEGGEAVYLASPEKEIEAESVKKNAMNVAYKRTLKADLVKLEEQREKLQKIMGFNNTRKTRSLMSVEDPRLEYGISVESTTQPRQDNDTRPPEDNPTRRMSKRRRGHKRKHGQKRRSKKRSGLRSKSNKTRRVNNKFMLKLIRSIDNRTEEHVEADIHCRHAPLYPNNTFVKDLVRLLINNNIKVVNNGRVFENKRVKDLIMNAVLNKMAGDDVTPADDTTSTPEKFAEPVTDWMDATTLMSDVTSTSLRLLLPPHPLRPPRPPPAKDVAAVLRGITKKERKLRTRRLKSYRFLAVTEQLKEQVTEQAPPASELPKSTEEELEVLRLAWTDEHPDEQVQMFEDERAEPSGGVKDLLAVIAAGETRRAFNLSNTSTKRLDPDSIAHNDSEAVNFVVTNNITFNMADQLFSRTTVGMEQLTSLPSSVSPRLAPVQLSSSTPHPNPAKTFMRAIDSYSSESSGESRSYD